MGCVFKEEKRHRIEEDEDRMTSLIKYQNAPEVFICRFEISNWEF